jgi:hypothetical protein
MPDMFPATLVQTSSTVADVVAVMESGLPREFFGRGSWPMRITLDSCEKVGRVRVIDETGFSRQVHEGFAKRYPDKSRNRRERATTEWRILVETIPANDLLLVLALTFGCGGGWGAGEIGEDRQGRVIDFY